jgi:hypothetical protein
MHEMQFLSFFFMKYIARCKLIANMLLHKLVCVTGISIYELKSPFFLEHLKSRDYELTKRK